MECTQCAMELSDDANFCPRCGKQTERGNQAGTIGADVADAPDSFRADSEADIALASVVSAQGLASRPNGKVQTSPFPYLPETATSAVLPVEKPSGQTVHALLAQANLHRMRHKWDDAIDCCVTVLRMQPANQTAHVLLGDIYRDQNRLDDAIQWYGMAVDLRPNPTDQAKLEQATQARDRMERAQVLRVQRGYGDSSASPIDRGTDLNTGTTNLMGLSPRRWLRGITATSLAFVALVLIALAWNSRRGPAIKVARTPSTPAPFKTGGFDLPPHHLDKTPPSYKVAEAANGNRVVVTGGTGIAPDQNSRTTTAAPLARTPSTIPPARPGSSLPTFNSPAAATTGTTPSLNLPPAPVQEVRPFSQTSPAQNNVAVAATSTTTSNRLTDGLQLVRTAGDGGVGATVLLWGAPSLVLDGGTHGQEALLRNVYRAARTAFANTPTLMKVKVFVETQTPQAGEAVVLEAEVDRSTANNANPDTDDPATLQNRLIYFRYTGAATAASAASPNPTENGTR